MRHITATLIAVLLLSAVAFQEAEAGEEPTSLDVADKVAGDISKASEKSEEIQNEHMKNVERDPGNLITKEAMKRIMASSSFLPQKAGSHSISVEPGQGFNGVTNYQPSGWKITESMSGKTEKKEESSEEKEPVMSYPMGLGPVLLNQCTERNYTKSSPCYNSKLFDLQNSICLKLMDAAGYIGVGFDGRGFYSSESRKTSLVQRVCANKATFLDQDIPDTMNVFGIFHTVAETKSFQSADQYMKYIRHKAGLSNQKGLFTSEASKYSKASSFGANLGGIGSMIGAGIGAVAGGPGGAMLGATIGGAVGGSIGGGSGSGSGKSSSKDEGSASSDMDQSDKSSKSEGATQNFFAIMYVNIVLYELTLDETKPSDLSLALLKDYIELPASYYSIGSDVKFQNFLLRWGTHFIRSGKFGGQLKVTKTMKTTKTMTSDQFASVAESEFKSMFSTLQTSYKQKSSSWGFLGFGGKSKSTSQKAKAKSKNEYKSQMNAETKNQQKFRQSDFTQTSVEAQGGTPEVAEALMDFYTPAFKQLFHDWIVSIKDYAKPFEFQLKSIHDLFNMRMKDLFPAGDVDFGCLKGGKSKVKIMVEAKTNKRFYIDTRVKFMGNKTFEEKIKVYCKYDSSEEFKKDFDRRRISLERAIGIYMVEGPFPTSSYELSAGQVGCEENTLTRFHLFANATKSMKFTELQSNPFVLVFDLPQAIPGITSAQGKFQVVNRGGTWFATRPDATVAHLYDGCALAGHRSKEPKICFRNLALTYQESSGFFYIDSEDYDVSKHRMPSLPYWLSGTTVARPQRVHSVDDLKRGAHNKEVAVPCNVRWLNSHRLDPNKDENCLHFTAATEGDIFVVFASIPRMHTTWRYLQINRQGVAFYKGFKLENRVQKIGMGVLGDANLYQSYFVCVIQKTSSVLMQYGKADPDSEVGTVYASYSYPPENGFSRLSFYSFGAGDKPASLMDIRLTKQMPVVKCLDKDYVKRDGHCVLQCHAECKRCKRARDNKACQQCRNVRVEHTLVIECLPVCPAGTTLSKTRKGLCQPCAAGTYKSKTGNQACSPCGRGLFSSAGAKKCTRCAAGTFNNKRAQAKCQSCAAGRFSSRTGSTSCSRCGVGKFSSSGSDHCDPCPYGHYSNVAGLAKCKPCSRGYYAARRGQRLCQKCPTGSSSAAGSRSCGNSCRAGQFSPRKGVPCRSCPAGSVSESAGSSSCSKCKAGSYQSSSGQSKCLPAPKGTYVSGTGATSASRCPAGRYNDKLSQTNSATCKPCSVGSHAPSAGASKCKLCSFGYYQASTGNAKCSKASPGYYVDRSGRTTQTACPHGTYSPSSGATKCTRCPKGHYAKSAGSSSCSKCPSGYFSAHLGLRSCSKCPAGGSSSPGSASCVKCAPGTYAVGSLCKICAAGSYSSSVGSSSCTKCPAGQYASKSKSAACSKCPAGFYTSGTGSTSCSRCPIGSYASGAGSRLCSKCPAGSYSSGTGARACSRCPAGSYTSGTGSRSCNKCPAGSYSSGTGSRSCSKCKPGSYARNIGSSSCINCPSRYYTASAGAKGCSYCRGLVSPTRTACHTRRVTATLTPRAKTSWGTWGGWSYCPIGKFVNGFKLRVERNLGNGDDTALNSIIMYCSRKGTSWEGRSIYSKLGYWGSWKPLKRCNGFFNAFNLRSEPSQGRGDDTAGNDFAMRCSSGNKWMSGGGQRWGNWVGIKYCPSGSAICALRTQIEKQQGRGDDTALNNVQVKCCKLPSF